MAAAHGFLAAMPRTGRLTLMRLADGATRWERDLRGEPVAYVWMLSGRVITADAHLSRVHLFNREDGRLIRRVLFQQPDPRHNLVNLVRAEGVLYGPQRTTNSDSVVAVDLVTGEPVWRLTVNKPLVQLFRPQDGYLGIGLLGGDVWIVDTKTGEIILDRRVPGARGVTNGVLFDGILLVQHTQIVGGRSLPRLVALDVATGDLIWHRHDFAPVVGLNASLRLFGGHLPALIQYSGQGLSRRKAMGLAVIDARTGWNIGADVRLISADSRATFSGDFRIFPGGVAIGTDEAFVALGTQPVDGSGRGDS
jgi:outer membrane protein assembly factor BamB